MKAKHISIAAVALLIAGGLWLTQSHRRANASHEPSADVSAETGGRSQDSISNGQPTPRQMLRPPDQTRRFRDFTPEQRVDFARKGHGPGG